VGIQPIKYTHGIRKLESICLERRSTATWQRANG
jgi:hypothetical protein